MYRKIAVCNSRFYAGTDLLNSLYVLALSQSTVYVQVMLKCAPQLREDQREWAVVVHSIIDSSVAANRFLLHLLSGHRQDEDTTFGEDVVEDFLVWCNQVWQRAKAYFYGHL